MSTRLRSLAPLAGSLIVAALVATGCSSNIVEVEVPATLTEPGTTVAIGETIRLPGTAYEDGGLYITEAEVGLTVLSITEGDASFYDKFDNGDEFASFTPWFVVGQVDLPADVEDLVRPSISAPFGALASGTTTEYLSLEGFTGTIKQYCPDVPDSGDETGGMCRVLLVPEGDELAYIGWDGADAHLDIAEAGPEEPYFDNPVRWEIPETPSE